MTLNDSQLLAIQSLSGPVVIEASAGSGKTRVITERIIAQIASGIPSASIVGVTFTNKAAKEMLSRIKLALPEFYDMPLITTFHSLGYSIIKEQEILLERKIAGICDAEDRVSLIKSIVKSYGINEDPKKIAREISSIKMQNALSIAKKYLKRNELCNL